MDRVDELRHAHDVLAPIYADRLATILDRMPIEQHVLGLFCQLVRESGLGTEIIDAGCGTGRLAPFFRAQGMDVRGYDLSPEMIRHARRDFPEHRFQVADLRALPVPEASTAGLVCWYSLMYLAPDERPAAFAELARVVRPGGYAATAFKLGDDAPRRGGASLGLGIGFDISWLSRATMEAEFSRAGFETVLWAERPADPDEVQPQGYLIVRRAGSIRSASA